MPLYINYGQGYGSIVFQDLYNILNHDGDFGFGDDPEGNNNLKKIIYNGTRTEESAKRMKDVTNLAEFVTSDTIISDTIIITGVDVAPFFLDDGEIVSIVDNGGGFTYLDEGTNTIRVFYDTTQAGGLNYFVSGQVSSFIAIPNCVMLYHELSHAYNIAIGEPNHLVVVKGVANSLQIQAAQKIAIIDENVIRTEKKLPLRALIDNFSTGNSGIGDQTDCPILLENGSIKKADPDIDLPCYVVTLCYQDDKSAEVIAFKKFRDECLRNHSIGRFLIDFYYKFSPGLVKKLDGKRFINRFIKRVFLDQIYKILKKRNGH